MSPSDDLMLTEWSDVQGAFSLVVLFLIAAGLGWAYEHLTGRDGEA